MLRHASIGALCLLAGFAVPAVAFVDSNAHSDGSPNHHQRSRDHHGGSRHPHRTCRLTHTRGKHRFRPAHRCFDPVQGRGAHATRVIAVSASRSGSSGKTRKTTTTTTPTTTPTTTTPTTTTTTTTTTGTTPTPTVSLTATPPAVQVGGQTTLAWSTSDVSACTASGAWAGPESTRGTAPTGSLAQTRTYTLTCTGPDGSASATLTVDVLTLTVSKIDSASGSTAFYATFGSWDQHVVSNQNGIFAAYSYEDNNYHTPDYWRLAQSTDGGQTWHVLYDSAQDGPNMVAPAIETDQSGNVYVIAPTNQDGVLTGPTLFYRFSPSNNYSQPAKYSLPIGGAGKYSTVYDPTRNVIDLLFWAYGQTHPNFFSISPAGVVEQEVTLFDPETSTTHAQPEYPILTISPGGTIFAGWTTMDDALWNNGTGTQNYYDAHFLASPDGGSTWVGPGGPVSLPVEGTSTATSFEIVNTQDPAEFQPWGSSAYDATGNWNLLQSMAFNKGELSFFYGGPTPQPHQAYARMNWSSRTIDMRMAPFFGTSDGSLSVAEEHGGSFSQDPSGQGRLYFTSLSLQSGSPRLVMMYSDDAGATWYEGATSDAWSEMGSQYINSYRYLDDGSVIGTLEVDPDPPYTGATVYFFRSTIVNP